MKLVKNKSSGRSFIVLEDTGDLRFLLVTPEGKIKRLERHLFGPPVAADRKDLQWDRHLTKTQMDAYARYDEDVDH
jgi:hypothetical protein